MLAWHALHRIVVNLLCDELSQVFDLANHLETSSSLDPGSLRQLESLSEGLSDVAKHGDFVSDLRGDLCDIWLLGEG